MAADANSPLRDRAPLGRPVSDLHFLPARDSAVPPLDPSRHDHPLLPRSGEPMVRRWTFSARLPLHLLARRASRGFLPAVSLDRRPCNSGDQRVRGGLLGSARSFWRVPLDLLCLHDFVDRISLPPPSSEVRVRGRAGPIRCLTPAGPL